MARDTLSDQRYLAFVIDNLHRRLRAAEKRVEELEQRRRDGGPRPIYVNPKVQRQRP